MHRNPQFAKTSQGRWVSLNVIDTTDSYVLQERQIISGSQKMAEVALSIVAVGFIFCAYLRFLLPQTLFGTNAVPSPLVFSMAAVGIGLDCMHSGHAATCRNLASIRRKMKSGSASLIRGGKLA
jgi:hypothetical protein